MPTPDKQKKPLQVVFALLIAVMAGAAGIWSANALLDRRVDLTGLEATRFPQARPLAPFELIDHNGRQFNQDALKNNWSFVFFGFTHCPDVCPATLSILNTVANRLQDAGTEARFIFVSVDPQRDTPEQLARFVTYFNQNFIGLTGTVQQIDSFTRGLGVMHMRVAAQENATSYLVDHTASIFLFDPDGRYHALFSPPLSAAGISDDFSKILKAYRQSG